MGAMTASKLTKQDVVRGHKLEQNIFLHNTMVVLADM